MSSRLFLVLLLATGCNTLAKHRLVGAYHRMDTNAVPGVVQNLRITDDKFIVSIPLAGELALDYTVDDKTIYVGSTTSSQLIFTIDGLGIISNRGTMGYDGTYAKQVEAAD
jgi:hypothetical protein